MEYKVVTRVPLGICLPDRDGLNSTPLTGAGFTLGVRGKGEVGE